jgi:hypothetical protein
MRKQCEEGATMMTWVQWQQGVLTVLRGELAEVLAQIEFDEVDWPAWQSLYAQGRSPRSAVQRALERDLWEDAMEEMKTLSVP